MRELIVGFFRLLLRIFFRRIELVGLARVPRDQPVIFAPNHPSGLIDPMFILCLSERRVSFLAKEPLFRMPLVGFFVRLFECLPVYRTTDGADPRKNRAMMTEAARLLAQNNALCIFPEGTSHSDPDLRPLRHGVARIGLAARAIEDRTVFIVPTALYYEQKQTFRSRAALAFGAPLEVPRVALGTSGEPSREATIALTNEVERAIEELLPTADTHEELLLAEHVERLLTLEGEDQNEENPEEAGLASVSLARRMQTRRQVLDVYDALQRERPDEVEELRARIRRLALELSALGLPIDAPRDRVKFSLRRRPVIPLLFLTAPLALLGFVVHLPTHEIVRALSFRYAGSEIDVVATAKLILGLFLYPLTWLGWALALALLTGRTEVLLAAALGPGLGWVTLRFHEELAALLHRAAFARKLDGAPRAFAELVKEREILTSRLFALARRRATEV